MPRKSKMAKCQLTKGVFAHVLPQKGIDRNLQAVKEFTRNTLRFGRNRIILKGDNENRLPRS